MVVVTVTFSDPSIRRPVCDILYTLPPFVQRFSCSGTTTDRQCMYYLLLCLEFTIQQLPEEATILSLFNLDIHNFN